jgi:Tol biopolymer transport system component
MAPDGSGRQVILSGRLDRTPGMPGEPLWSPSGTHLVFLRFLQPSRGTSVKNIYRAAASGADEVLLTRDLDGWAEPERWVPNE